MLGKLAWNVFAFTFGLINLVLMVAVAGVRDGAFTKGESESKKKELALAQERFWGLAGQPLQGFTHRFFTLRNGLKIHYIVKLPVKNSSPRNLAIFIHGFPDSCLVWRRVLTSPSLDSHILIAVDLPGYGGSDNLPNYGATESLEAMSEFILGMREEFLHNQANCVVVGHDWGGIVAARLASEASQLADRWVVASAVVPQHWYSNVATKAASAKQMLRTWFRNPLRFSLLKNALSTLKPVFSQIGRSFYVFIFNLPYPLSVYFATFGNYWLLRVMHDVAAGFMGPDGKLTGTLEDKEAAEYMAASAGPGEAQLEDGKLAYPEAVNQRIDDFGMYEKIRIYREGILLSPWEKSLETVVALSEIPASARRHSSGSAGAGLFDDGPPGALKAPATVVYGKNDPGFDRRLALEGIADALARGSQVVLVENGFHWLPNEDVGSAVLERVAGWALGDEKRGLSKSLEGVNGWKMLVDK